MFRLYWFRFYGVKRICSASPATGFTPSEWTVPFDLMEITHVTEQVFLVQTKVCFKRVFEVCQ